MVPCETIKGVATMMGSAIIAFWGVSLALVMTPGADWAYAITAGMRDKALAPAIAGLLLGYVGITLVVAAGVGSLVAEHPMVLTCGAACKIGSDSYSVQFGSCGCHHPGLEQIDFGAPIHLSLDCFQAVDLALNLAAGPRR